MANKGERNTVLRMPARGAGNSGDEVLVRCGEVAPRSGVYEAIHKSPKAETEGAQVVAVRGEIMQPCRGCGEAVAWRLVYAAPHITEDENFCNQ